MEEGKVANGAEKGNASTGKRPQGVKRRRNPTQRDPNAPKRPCTAYQLFFSGASEQLRSNQPDIKFSELSHTLAAQWTSKSLEQKQPYLELSERDKQRHIREMDEYQKTDSYKQFMSSLKAKNEAKVDSELEKGAANKSLGKPAAESDAPPTSSKPTPISLQQDFIPGTDIPIFTEHFLKYNREMESEVRKLRQANSELEEENALLSRHVENMQIAIRRMQAEMEKHQTRNAALKDHLESIRRVTSAVFHDTPLPGTNDTPTQDNIDSYMGKLQVISLVPRATLQLLSLAVRTNLLQLWCRPGQKAYTLVEVIIASDPKKRADLVTMVTNVAQQLVKELHPPVNDDQSTQLEAVEQA